MIESIKFQDIKMFKGKHSVEFKPLTIFTGANNAGKSTLLSLTRGMISQYGKYIGENNIYVESLFPFSEQTSGTKPKDPISIGGKEHYLYKLQNILLDDISSSYISRNVPESIHFHYENEPIITFNPEIFTYEEDEYYLTLSGKRGYIDHVFAV